MVLTFHIPRNMSLCLGLCHGFPKVVPARRTEWGTILPPENFTPVEHMSMFHDGCVFTVKDRHSFDKGTFLSGLSPFRLLLNNYKINYFLF